MLKGKSINFNIPNAAKLTIQELAALKTAPTVKNQYDGVAPKEASDRMAWRHSVMHNAEGEHLINYLDGKPATLAVANNGGLFIQQSEPEYLALGKIIDNISIAAGASYASDWYEDTTWVRKIIAHINSADQAYEFAINLKDQDGNIGRQVLHTGNATSANFDLFSSDLVLGHAVQFELVNTSSGLGASASDSTLSIQLFGGI